MVATYDITTARGQVRLLCTDTVTATPIFDDSEIDFFLTMYDQNVRRAAAKALDTIASSQVLTLKVIKLLDIQTDGSKVAAALMQAAQQLREEAGAFEDPQFDIAEQVPNVFAFRERLLDQWLRGVTV